MSYFRNICLLKAPQAFDIPNPQGVSDLTEICYLAAVVKEHVDTVSIPVDFYGSDPYGKFEQCLKTTPFDLVAISAMTGAVNNALRLAEIAKRFDKYVVLGGYHPTAMYEEVLKSPYVDAVVVGEGEMTFRELVTEGPSRSVRGLAFRENGGVVYTGQRPLISDPDSLPHPLRSARPVRFGDPGYDYYIDTLYTSRGCPWNCTFCANEMVNKKWRARSPENVIEEMESIHDPHRRKVLKIWDANFLTNVNRVEKICDLMIERGLTNFKIYTETRVADVIRAEGIMGKLRQVGLYHLSLGIESPNEETLKLMKKKNRSDDISRAVEILKRHKVKAQGFFIIGHYSESTEDTKKYPEYAESIGLRSSIFMVMTPYPGTRIFNEYVEENKLRSLDWDLYNNFCAVVETRGMDIRGLNSMLAYCYGRFYLRHAFLSQSKSFAIALPLLQQMVLLYTIFSLKDRTTPEERKELLFEFLRASSGRTLSREMSKKPPLMLRIFRYVTVRFSLEPGKNLDIHIAHKGNTRYLTVTQSMDDAPVRGITLSIDSIIELGKKVSPDRAVLLACMMEPIKNSPSGKLKKALSLLTDREFLSAGFEAFRFIAVNLTRGTWAVLSHSIKHGRCPAEAEAYSK
jgi:magnesium-protoporphyrin IX monomethyl ester (oxidative) cyclase